MPMSKDTLKPGKVVLAKWPGSNLYYDAEIIEVGAEKISVRFSEGSVEKLPTKFIFAKSLKPSSETRAKSPGRRRSRSYSRSPSRSRTRSAAEDSPVSKPRGRPRKTQLRKSTPTRSSSRKRAPVQTKERPETPQEKEVTEKNSSKTESVNQSPNDQSSKVTKRKLAPTRSSSRIAAMRSLEEKPMKLLLDSEEETMRTSSSTQKQFGFFSHVRAHLMILILPCLLLTIRFSCTKTRCTVMKFPEFPKSWKQYVTPTAFGAYCSWNLFLLLLCSIPFGRIHTSSVGGARRRYRFNGFLVLVVSLVGVSALNYFQVISPSYVVKNFNRLMVSSMIFSAVLAVFLQIKSHWTEVSDLSPSANTGSLLTNFFVGRETNPRIGETYNVKFVSFRVACVTWVVVAVQIALASYVKSKALSAMNPSLVMITIFQVVYVSCILFYEEFLSTMATARDSMGFALCFITYSILPFFSLMPSLYIFQRNPVLPIWSLALLTAMFVLGMVIFIHSNLQKHRFRTNPYDPRISHLETITTSRGTKLLVSGWWGWICHPNYFGDLIVIATFSFVAGFDHAFPHIMLAFAILNLIFRAYKDDVECAKKYASAWSTYRQRVKHRLIPYVW